jgi:hypothetical protein
LTCNALRVIKQLKQGVIVLLLKKVIMLMATILLVAGLFGCEKEGPAEKAGKQIDKVFEDVKDKAEDASK